MHSEVNKMGDFKLKKHRVKEAAFLENTEVEKKNNIEVGVEGSILIPKDSDANKNVVVQLKFHFGKKEERLFLYLETISVFEPENIADVITESMVHEKCLPIALSQLRKTVKMVTESYGMPPLDLPPFKEENL